MQQIHPAFGPRSVDAVKQGCHKLDSAAFRVGAMEFVEHCEILKAAAKEENWDVIDSQEPKMDALIPRSLWLVSNPCL